jgi:hypothetical protein
MTIRRVPTFLSGIESVAPFAPLETMAPQELVALVARSSRALVYAGQRAESNRSDASRYVRMPGLEGLAKECRDRAEGHARSEEFWTNVAIQAEYATRARLEHATEGTR